MLPYQTYYPQMNNGYVQQMPNPYQQRMEFLQTYQQSLQQPLQPTQMSGASQQMNVFGKIVDSVEMVRSMDIPMDGNMYYFPKADGTEIFGKQWIVTEGRTRILSFKPVLEDSPNLPQQEERLKFDLSDEATGAFMQRFDELVGKIDKLEESMTKPMTKTTISKTKKESESE